MLVHTLVITWYARHGHDPAGIAARRTAEPWYTGKREPAFEDMLTVARAYAGHTGSGSEAGATSTYVRADLSEVAAALAALTGEPHPLAASEGV